MEQGYYIHYGSRFQSGVSRKIDDQINALSFYYNIEEIVIETGKRSFFDKVFSRLPLGYVRRSYKEAFYRINNPSFIYMRYVDIDRGLLNFLSSIKKKWPECHLVLELFSYPYDYDCFLNKKRYIAYIKDKCYRKQLYKYVDLIATFSEYSTIFNIPAIQTSNGIDFEKITLRKHTFSPNDSTINLIVVALFQNHHGYERLIEGLGNYYSKNVQPKREIILHMVGYGPEEGMYIDKCEQFEVSSKVIFYGKKSGSELDDIYDKADMAVTSLGMYKIGHKRGDFLKTGEYMAKGLPIVTGCPINALDSNYKYYLEFPNDNTPIDMDRVVEFYDSVKDDPDLAETIRKYGECKFDIRKKMEPIVNYFKK